MSIRNSFQGSGCLLTRSLHCASQSTKEFRLLQGFISLLHLNFYVELTLISTAISFVQTVTKVKLYVPMYLPAGTSITWYAGVEDLGGNVTWSAAFANPVGRDMDGFFSEYSFDELTLPGSGGTKIRLRADLTATIHWQYGPEFGEVG